MSEKNSFLALGVLGKYKVLLCNKVAGDAGVPVCEAVKNVETMSCDQTGMLGELGPYRGTISVEAIAVSNFQSNVVTGTA